MPVLITGGNGFIGTNFIKQYYQSFDMIVNLDCHSYAANKNSLDFLKTNGRYEFINGATNDRDLVKSILTEFDIDMIINFAAETHVDRSIESGSVFLERNVVGTYNLLDAALSYSTQKSRSNFKIIHISTDEVFGALGVFDMPFNEDSQYCPNNPYAASKASAEMFCRSFSKTHELSIVVVNSSNNYGPYQNQEKLIPKVINKAVSGQDIPIYGDGSNIRDWIFVSDNCDAIFKICKQGRVGEKYNVGGGENITNLNLVQKVCELLEKYRPKRSGAYSEQISFVIDRKGHDFKYQMDCSKIKRELNWSPSVSLEEGLSKTIEWYLQNPLKD